MSIEHLGHLNTQNYYLPCLSLFRKHVKTETSKLYINIALLKRMRNQVNEKGKS